MKTFIASGLRRLADRISPPKTFKCELVVSVDTPGIKKAINAEMKRIMAETMTRGMRAY